MQNQTAARYIRLTTGCLLFMLGLWGLYYGVRAAIAQSIYFQVRHGSEPVSTDMLLAGAEQAAQWYPHNFYFPFLAADRALDAAWAAETAEQGERYLRAAAYWIGQGLRQNPYRVEIQWTQTRLLEAEGDLEGAIAHWKAFVNTEYWNPDHHALLGDLLLRAGDLEGAATAMALAHRSRTHSGLAREIREIQSAVQRR